MTSGRTLMGPIGSLVNGPNRTNYLRKWGLAWIYASGCSLLPRRLRFDIVERRRRERGRDADAYLQRLQQRVRRRGAAEAPLPVRMAPLQSEKKGHGFYLPPRVRLPTLRILESIELFFFLPYIYGSFPFLLMFVCLFVWMIGVVD